MDLKSIYKLNENVVMVDDKSKDRLRLLKLDEDGFYFQATLLAAEVIRSIDNKSSLQEIIEKLALSYEETHRPEIRAKAQELIVKLLDQNLINEV